MEASSTEKAIKRNLIAIYGLLVIGLLAPVACFFVASQFDQIYLVAIPGLAALFVAWCHKNAAELLDDSGSFAVQGVRELRQEYLLHVNRLGWAWLLLAAYGVIIAAL